MSRRRGHLLTRKFIVLPVVPILLYLIGKRIAYSLVFNGGIAITDADFASARAMRSDFHCEGSNSTSKKELTIRFSYDYPFVDFDGILVIRDRTIRENSETGRTLYAGAYRRVITIRDLCQQSGSVSSDSMDLSFLFITEKRIHSWNSSAAIAVFQYTELAVLLQFDDRLDANVAIITPKN